MGDNGAGLKPVVCIAGAAAAAALLRWWAPQNTVVRVAGATLAAAPPLALAALEGSTGSPARLMSAAGAGLVALSAFSLVVFAPPRVQGDGRAKEVLTKVRGGAGAGAGTGAGTGAGVGAETFFRGEGGGFIADNPLGA
jgi:hypothetical protein